MTLQTLQQVQELYLKILEIIKSKIDIRNFDSYIFVSLKNHAFKFMKKELLNNNYIEFDEKIDNKLNIDCHYYLLINHLTKNEQRILKLYFIYGYSIKEIAKKFKTYPKKISTIIKQIKNI